MPDLTNSLESRLIASGLITSDQFAQCREAVGDSADDAFLIEFLVKLDLLTKWQVSQLQAGKTKGFALSQYKLLDPLGAGGMGQVFRALDTKLGRQVAIKVLPKRLATPQAIERFKREGEAALQVEHQHIVRCFELGHHGETHFIVMELVEGTTLAKYIEKKWLLSARETARIGYEVALALEHARQRGIIHRDIKPSNIMLTRGGKVKLADLGLAKFFDEREDRPATITHTGAFMGTVDYCAPEQAEDAKRADTRSDIYSLGCTLYQCLTGQPPFAQGTNVQKIVAHRERDPEPIRALNDAVPQFFADLIAKRMLAKRPEERFQTPAEAAAALSPWAKGEDPVIADFAGLHELGDDDYSVEPAQPVGSTSSDRPNTSTSIRSNRRRSSSALAGTSAIGTALRGLFVQELSGKFIRLTMLAGILGGLVWLWRADPLGLNQYLPGERQSESAAQGEMPVAPPSITMPLSMPVASSPGTVPTGIPASPVPPGISMAPINTWYDSTDPVVVEAAGKANARDLNGAIGLLRQKLTQSPNDRGALQVMTQLAYHQAHTMRQRGDQAGACNGYIEAGGYARRLANGHTNLSAREQSLVRLQIYNEACAYALTGQSDKAIETLKEAIQWGWSDFAHMDRDSDLNSIRSLSAFQSIFEYTTREGRKLRLCADVDFSKTDGGFVKNEADYAKVGWVDGEWQYMAKKSGNWFWTPQPGLNGPKLAEFVFEAEARLVEDRPGGWFLRFSDQPGKSAVDFHVRNNRSVGVFTSFGTGTDKWLMPWTTASAMKPITEPNTVRLEVIAGNLRIFVNDRHVVDATENRIVGTRLTLFTAADNPPVDVRFRRIRLWRPE